VVAITSRLATAEKLDDVGELQPIVPTVVADPFAGSPSETSSSSLTESAVAATHVTATASREPHLRRQQTPWTAIAMTTAAGAFGVTAALALLLRPTPTQPATVVVQAPAPIAAPAPSSIAPTAPAATDSAEPAPAASRTKGPIASAGPAKAAASASSASAAPHGPLDLHGLNSTNVIPTDDPSGGDTTRAPGQCLSSGQVQQVYGIHATGIRRACWDRNPTTRPATNVSVSLTVGPDGNAQDVTTSGDEPSVAKCIENEVRGWRFPSMGCSQKVNIPFHFVRQ
jgi:hypothetical protein